MSQHNAPFRTKNKDIRHNHYLKTKKTTEKAKREERFRRKREEDLQPKLRTERRLRNVPASIDRKRVWDDVDFEAGGDGIGASVDVVGVHKKPKITLSATSDMTQLGGLTEDNLKRAEEAANDGENLQNEEALPNDEGSDTEEDDGLGDDLASLMDELSEDSDGESLPPDKELDAARMPPPTMKGLKAPSPPASTTSSSLSHIPDALAAKFPTLFHPPKAPKVLVTTGLNSTLHHEAELFTMLFPNSTYIRRKVHRYGHEPSLREIASGAIKREYTTVIALAEDKKQVSGLTMIHLPSGPTFHFSVKNFVPGKRLPGHGNPTDHYPELILNGFKTPLGLLTASMFRTLFPPAAEIQGRQVVTLHNQRDYIFVRRHRYVFRDRRPTERQVTQGGDGPDANKAFKGAEDLRAGLQELGPRFTLKLRRIDRGIQRASGQEWEWKARMEKQRTRFQL